jgi:hypothetical protein
MLLLWLAAGVVASSQSNMGADYIIYARRRGRR